MFLGLLPTWTKVINNMLLLLKDCWLHHSAFLYWSSSLCVIVHSVINSVLHGKICRNDELVTLETKKYLGNVRSRPSKLPHTKMLLYCFMIRYLWYTLHKHIFHVESVVLLQKHYRNYKFKSKNAKTRQWIFMVKIFIRT